MDYIHDIVFLDNHTHSNICNMASGSKQLFNHRVVTLVTDKLKRLWLLYTVTKRKLAKRKQDVKAYQIGVLHNRKRRSALSC